MGSAFAKLYPPGYRTTCYEIVDEYAPNHNEFSGRGSAVVTGVTSGIGIPSAESLLLAGFDQVFATARNMKKAAEIKKKLTKKHGKTIGDRLTYVNLDLSDLESVAKAAKEINEKSGKKGVAVILCSAGTMMTPYQATKQGIEWQFGVNHVAHALLVELLLPAVRRASASLTKESPARIVAVSSVMHTSATLTTKTGFDERQFKYKKGGDYNRAAAYGTSKLCNIMMSLELDERFRAANENIVAMSLHPGVINTNLFKHIPCSCCMCCMRPGLKSIPQGAATSIYCCLSDTALHRGDDHLGVEQCECRTRQGRYFSDCHACACSNKASVENAQQLHRLTMKLIDDVAPGLRPKPTKSKKQSKASATKQSSSSSKKKKSNKTANKADDADPDDNALSSKKRSKVVTRRKVRKSD